MTSGLRVEPFRISGGLSSFGEERRGRALRDVLRGRPLPPDLARAAADTRRRLAEGGVRERVERLLQVVELARDEHEALLALGRAVEALELVCDPVEPLEQGVELAISDVVLLHGSDSTDGSGGRLAF